MTDLMESIKKKSGTGREEFTKKKLYTASMKEASASITRQDIRHRSSQAKRNPSLTFHPAVRLRKGKELSEKVGPASVEMLHCIATG